MNKRLQLYIGVIVLMILLIILSVIFGNHYRVYLLSDAAPIFLEDTPTSKDIGSPKVSDALPAQEKQLQFLGQSVALLYNEVLSNEMHAYTSEDNKINCWYAVDTDKIRLISAEGWFYLPPGTAVTESSCLEWIYQQVSMYYAEDWSMYKHTCATAILSTASGVPQQIERSGFVAAAGERESISAYVFTFTRSVGELETTDVIQAYIRPDNGFVALEFSAHNFDDTAVVKVNMKHLENAVKDFLRDHVDKTQYKYISHRMQQPKLSYINGQLCCVCNVSIEVTSATETQTIEKQLAVTLQ